MRQVLVGCHEQSLKCDQNRTGKQRRARQARRSETECSALNTAFAGADAGGSVCNQVEQHPGGAVLKRSALCALAVHWRRRLANMDRELPFSPVQLKRIWCTTLDSTWCTPRHLRVFTAQCRAVSVARSRSKSCDRPAVSEVVWTKVYRPCRCVPELS